MKKLISFSIILFVISCGVKKTSVSNPLYEILYQQTDGGAKIQFYEVLTEEYEIGMLLNDKKLKGKVKKSDILTSNFVVMNMGQKISKGYSIAIDNIEETPTQIIITVKDVEPKPGELTMTVMTDPYCILKVNSKKEIVFK